jgi:hypothetical protein
VCVCVCVYIQSGNLDADDSVMTHGASIYIHIVLSHVSFGRRVQVRTPWYVWCAARGHGLREQQRGIADEIDSLREAMAKEKERANSADVECIHLTGWS